MFEELSNKKQTNRIKNMQDILDIAPPIEELKETNTEVSSTPSAIFTMLITIAALLLTTITLIYHATSSYEGNPKELLASLDEQAFTAPKIFTLTTETETADVEANDSVNTDVKVEEDKKNKLSGFFARVTKVRWPELNVTGYAKSSTSSGGFAIINGEHVVVEGYVGDVQLIEIRDQEIVVELEGERKTIAIN